MVAALNETLLADPRKPAVTADVHALIDAEVAEKKGASGLTVRGGYAAVKKASPTVVNDAVDRLLPAFFAELEPFWQEFKASGTGTFADFLTARGDAVAEALLSVTDDRAERSSRKAVKKVYDTMRGGAKKNVIEALPRLGALIEKHA